MDNVHDVVKLLLARMESHPEEFKDPYLLSEVQPHIGQERWDRALRVVIDKGTDADKEAIKDGLRPIYMKQAHEWVMDELCNGEERRRKEREAREAEEQRYRAQQAYANQTLTGSYQAKLANAVQQSKEAIAANALNNAFKYQPGIDAYEFTHQGLTTTYTREALEDNPGIFAGIKKALGI